MLTHTLSKLPKLSNNRKLDSRKKSHALVGVGVVVVVLDSPGLKGVDERHEHQCAYDVFHQLILAEAAVAAIMADHKHLHVRMHTPHQNFAAVMQVRQRGACRRNCVGSTFEHACRRAFTPVQAVPAKAHANGSIYQGEMEMRYTLSATLTTVVATAPHALNGLISNTCMQHNHTSYQNCICAGTPQTIAKEPIAHLDVPKIFHKLIYSNDGRQPSVREGAPLSATMKSLG